MHVEQNHICGVVYLDGLIHIGIIILLLLKCTWYVALYNANRIRPALTFSLNHFCHALLATLILSVVVKKIKPGLVHVVSVACWVGITAQDCPLFLCQWVFKGDYEKRRWVKSTFPSTIQWAHREKYQPAVCHLLGRRPCLRVMWSECSCCPFLSRIRFGFKLLQQ